MAQDTSDIAKDYAKIKDDISALKTDLAGILKLLEKEGLSQVKEALHSVKDNCDFQKVEDCVKKNPKESIAVAFAVGAFLALFLGRR